MGSGFPDDPDRRTKLDVAKDCLLHVCKQLGPADRISVITFNTHTETVLPTGYCTPSHINKQVPLPQPLNTPLNTLWDVTAFVDLLTSSHGPASV